MQFPKCHEKLAFVLHNYEPQLAVDILRACGYTRKAAKRALEASGAVTFAKDTT